jgi:hypothetical protein
MNSKVDELEIRQTQNLTNSKLEGLEIRQTQNSMNSVPMKKNIWRPHQKWIFTHSMTNDLKLGLVFTKLLITYELLTIVLMLGVPYNESCLGALG